MAAVTDDGISRKKVDDFLHRHQTQVVALLYLDMVASTSLKDKLGDSLGSALVTEMRRTVRGTLESFEDAEEIFAAGDGMLAIFLRPSEAVKFALLLHAELRKSATEKNPAPQVRIGIHLGEVFITATHGTRSGPDILGLQADLAARLMSLACGGQTLLGRAVFDNARAIVRADDLAELRPLVWLNHGQYRIRGIETPMEICEVGEESIAPLTPPVESEQAVHVIVYGQDSISGWRPALGLEVPTAPGWIIQEKLGQGGFGEVWKARHKNLHTLRVFKFCFHEERLSSLKREMTLFLLIKDQIGEHPGIVQFHDVNLESAPYFIAMDFVDATNLQEWCKERGNVQSVELECRLEIVAQIAEVLQTAHDSGVIHRDIKPSNVLVLRNYNEANRPKLACTADQIRIKLTDFGIGQVVSRELLSDKTGAGFTDTALTTGLSSQPGTRLYMAPELIAGHAASTRSDTYSLGVLLYQMITGDLYSPIPSDWDTNIADPLLVEDLRMCLAGDPMKRFNNIGRLAGRLRKLPERRAEAELQKSIERQAIRRKRLAIAFGISATVMLLVSIALGFGLYREQIQRRHAERETQRATAAENKALLSLKSGLEDLIKTQFTTRHYEGVVDTARELKNLVGAESLQNEDLRRMVRMSVFMNNQLQVHRELIRNPLGMLGSASNDAVHLVTADALYRFTFKTAKLEKVATLPERVQFADQICMNDKGRMWLGTSNTIYKQDDKGEFNALLRINELAIPAAKNGGEGNTAEKLAGERTWMETAGRQYPITGLAITPDERIAVVGLGDAIICSIDLETKSCTAWWYGVSADRPHRMFVERPSKDNAPSRIQISSDGKMAAWRQFRENQENVTFLTLPELGFHCRIYNRNIPIPAFSFTPDSKSFHLLLSQGMETAKSLSAYLKPSVSDVLPSDWRGTLRVIPTSPVVVAGYSKDASYFASVDRQGRFLFTSSDPDGYLKMERRIAPGDWISCEVLDDGIVALLTRQGDLCLYDGLSFSTRELAPPDMNLKGICAAENPSTYYGCRSIPDSRSRTSQMLRMDTSNTTSTLAIGILSTMEKRLPSMTNLAASATGQSVSAVGGEHAVVFNSANGEILHDVRGSRNLSFQNFSPDGQTFAVGIWSGGLSVMETKNWSEIFAYQNAIPRDETSFEAWMYDGLLLSQNEIIFCGADDGYYTQCWKDRQLRWKVKSQKGVPTRIIPWVRPDGETLVWVKYHYGDFACHQTSDGKVLARQTNWVSQEPEWIQTLSQSDVVAFRTHAGRIQLCRKSDMEAIFDPDSCGLRAQMLSFNSDATQLACINEGRLSILECARWRENPLVEKNLYSLLGESLHSP